MKFWHKFRSKKYLNRVFLLMTATIFVVVVMFLMILYYNVENLLMKNDYKANTKILNQIKYNIEYMDTIVKNIGLSVYQNNDIKNLMMHDDISYNELYRIKGILKNSIVSTNPFVHSIYIYNGNNKTYYATDESILDNDDTLEEVIQNSSTIPKLAPVPRKIRNLESFDERQYRDIFSYFLYSSIGENKEFDMAVILNVKSEWFFDNIRVLNAMDAKERDKIFILDGAGNFILDNPEDTDFKVAVSEIYDESLSSLHSQQHDINFLTKKISKENYLVSYIRINNPDWILVKIQPYNEVFQYLNNFRATTMLITAIFLIVVLFGSIPVAEGIYKPIGKLVAQVNSMYHSKTLDGTKDEISYINEVLKYTSNQLNKYEEQRLSSKGFIKEYILRKFILDSQSVDKEDFGKRRHENNIVLKLDSNFSVCVIRIDNYRQYVEKHDINDQKLYKFAIGNIFSEVVSREFRNEVVDMRAEHLVMILNVDKSDQDFERRLLPLLKEAQRYTAEILSFSVTIAVSNTHHLNDLTKQYNVTLNHSAYYRYIYGKYSIILPHMVRKNESKFELEKLAGIEKKLTQEIKYGNMQNIEELLLKSLCQMVKYNYNDIRLGIFHLTNTIKATIDEINEANLKPIFVDFNVLDQRLYELETIDELYYLLKDIVTKITCKKENSVDSKHKLLVDTIKNIVDNNYRDTNLSLKEIASVVKMSPAVVGKIFKTNTNMSFSEYINDVRLNNAVRWMEDTNLNIQQIMTKVGFENDSYFYRLFKKKFGTTPKDYMLNKVRKEI